MIDSYERIVRFNNYQIVGYEKYVGKKEDIWCMSSSGMVERRPYSKPIWIPHNTRNPKNEKRIQALKKHYSGIELIPESVCETLCSKIIGLSPKKWCTTGMYAIYWASLNYENVAVVGFDFFSDVSAGEKPKHYFTHAKDEKLGSAHDTEKEKAYYKSMLKNGVIEELG